MIHDLYSYPVTPLPGTGFCPKRTSSYTVLKGGGVQGEGVTGIPENSVWEDWGILGNIREN